MNYASKTGYPYVKYGNYNPFTYPAGKSAQNASETWAEYLKI